MDLSGLGIPGFEVLDLLGRGGMGTVYLAVDRATGLRVALKVLPVSNADDRQRRFSREVGALAAMRHPGVVRPLKHGTTDRFHWFSMEYVEGPDLQQILDKKGPLSSEEVVRIVLELASTLGAVHAAGLAHRDIKPANVLLHPDGRTVLADFGVVRELRDPATRLTMHPIGTPSYMAPEVLRSRDVDWVRVDVFSLAVLLARSILGRLPEGPWDIQELPPVVASVVERGMATRPADRFGDMAAFAQALRSKPRRSKRWAWGAGAVALLVLAALGVGWMQPGVRKKHLAPMQALLDQGRPDDAERAFRVIVSDLNPSMREYVWWERAQLLGHPEAWMDAWTRAERLKDETFKGLVASLEATHDYQALDLFLDRLPRDDHDRIGRTLAYHGRLEAAAGHLEPPLATIVSAWSEMREIAPMQVLSGDPDSAWMCGMHRCLHRDGSNFVPPRGSIVSMAPDGPVYWNGEVAGEANGRQCALELPGRAYDVAWWNGELLLVNTEPPSLHRVNLDSCEVGLFGGPDLWRSSYLNGVLAVDVDRNGSNELLVLLGPPFGYELVLFDEDHKELHRTLIGNPIGLVPLGSDWVVIVGRPHANGVLYDLREEGAHQVRWTGDRFEVVRSFPGSWRMGTSGDFDGDGVDELVLVNNDDELHLFAGGGLPLRIGDVRVAGVAQLDDDRANELAIERSSDLRSFVFGLAGDATIEHPRRGLPGSTGDPGLDRDLSVAALGMPGRAATRIEERALTLSGADAAIAWSHAASLWESANRPSLAGHAWIQAASYGGVRDWAPSVETMLSHGLLGQTATLLEQAPPEVVARWAVLGAPEEVDLSSTGSWSLLAPESGAAARPLGLRFRSVGEQGEIGRLSLRRMDEFAGFEAEITVNRLEFAADMRLRLWDGIEQVEIKFRSHGSRGAIYRTATSGMYPERRLVVDGDPEGPHRYRVSVSVRANGTLLRVHDLDDDTEGSRIVDRVLDGDLELAVLAAGPSGPLGSITLTRLQVWGLRARQGRALDPTNQPTARRRNRLRFGSFRSPSNPTPTQLDDFWAVLGGPYNMHLQESGLGDRLAALDLSASPDLPVTQALAVQRADVFHRRGDPQRVLDALAGLNLQGVWCGVGEGLRAASYQALGDGNAAMQHARATASCGLDERVLQMELWHRGLLAGVDRLSENQP